MDIPPVDVVYTWVDGADPQHQAAVAQHKPGGKSRAKEHGSSYESCRWRNSGEIRASIASVLTFAPWIRNIFVVCSLGQVPELDLGANGDGWVTEGGHDVFVVQDTAICPTTPVFNSHAIEANLHRIPGLADRFLYLCDDMFLGAPLSYGELFDLAGGTHRPKVLLGNTHLTAGANFELRRRSAALPAWFAARINNFRALDRTYGRKPRRDLIHQARPLSKDVAEHAWGTEPFASLLRSTCTHRFRSTDDVEPCGLFSWVGIQTKKAVAVHCGAGGAGPSHKYFGIGDLTNISELRGTLRQRPCKLYCLNDTMVRPSAAQLAAYRDLLATGLPHHRHAHKSVMVP